MSLREEEAWQTILLIDTKAPGAVHKLYERDAAYSGCTFINAWGSGPFVLDTAGEKHLFVDNDRQGPRRIDAVGLRSDHHWDEQHPFWPAYRLWQAQGCRLAPDGATCIWLPVSSTSDTERCQ